MAAVLSNVASCDELRREMHFWELHALYQTSRPDVVAALNFIFSVKVLPTDDFLLQLTKADPQGFVSIDELVAHPHLVELNASSEDIFAAAPLCEELVLSPCWTRIRRRTTMPRVNFVELKVRTAIVVNVREKRNDAAVKAAMAKLGEIDVIRFFDSVPSNYIRTIELTKGVKDVNHGRFCIVHFAQPDSVKQAAMLFRKHTNNWWVVPSAKSVRDEIKSESPVAQTPKKTKESSQAKSKSKKGQDSAKGSQPSASKDSSRGAAASRQHGRSRGSSLAEMCEDWRSPSAASGRASRNSNATPGGRRSRGDSSEMHYSPNVGSAPRRGGHAHVSPRLTPVQGRPTRKGGAGKFETQVRSGRNRAESMGVYMGPSGITSPNPSSPLLKGRTGVPRPRTSSMGEGHPTLRSGRVEQMKSSYGFIRAAPIKARRGKGAAEEAASPKPAPGGGLERIWFDFASVLDPFPPFEGDEVTFRVINDHVTGRKTAVDIRTKSVMSSGLYAGSGGDRSTPMTPQHLRGAAFAAVRRVSVERASPFRSATGPDGSPGFRRPRGSSLANSATVPSQ